VPISRLSGNYSNVFVKTVIAKYVGDYTGGLKRWGSLEVKHTPK
jgi:hypothetical protein